MESVVQQKVNVRWLLGGALIALGMLILLMNVGVLERFSVWRFWPLLLIVAGIARFVQSDKKSEGFWFVALGVWLQVSLLRLWDLSFGETWPAIVIALGIFIMWESLEREARRRKAEQALGTTSPHQAQRI